MPNNVFARELYRREIMAQSWRKSIPLVVNRESEWFLDAFCSKCACEIIANQRYIEVDQSGGETKGGENDS